MACLGAGMLAWVLWVACLHEWCASMGVVIVYLHGQRGWRACVGSVLVWLAS